MLKTKNGEYRGGVWYPAEPVKLKVSNPKGYNKYKKNKAKKVEIVKPITKEDVTHAYKEYWIAKRALLSKAQKYSRLIKQYFDLNKIDKELEEQFFLPKTKRMDE